MFDIGALVEFFTVRPVEKVFAATLGVIAVIALLRFVPKLVPFLGLASKESPNAELEKELERANELKNRADEATRALTEELVQERERVTELNSLISDISVGTIWHRRPSLDIPTFRPRADGRPPIVAVVNLKGGVGKTTLTANLGAALWSRNRRVLLVDLDYQGSLTLLCLTEQQQLDALRARRFIERVLLSADPDEERVFEIAERIGTSEGWIAATDECLEQRETQIMAEWIAGSTTDDVRYRLRAALHNSTIAEQYDLILLDCPPRLTSACVNGLAAADFALIPVLPDLVSADAAPRLVEHLRKLKLEYSVCPDISLLGLVANKAQNKSGLSPRQQQVWESLHDECLARWGEPVHRFQTVVPQSVEFASAAHEGRFASEGSLSAVFRDLVDEIHQRMPIRERIGTPVVPR